jgi:sulfatase maturation enzyme AslB (radical SAM superfamily)
MEKLIKSLIAAFLKDYDVNKIYAIDRALCDLLFKKELYLANGGDKRCVSRWDVFLSRWVDYREKIYKLSLKRHKNDVALLREIIFPHPNRLVLLITHSCQLRCRYCRVRKFKTTMGKKVLFQSIDLFFSRKSQERTLQFFGGEPLLCFNLIQDAVQYAKKFVNNEAQKVQYLLTTNGIELTPDKIDFFKKNNFIIEYSIDGVIEHQLHERRNKDGFNYYERMLNNFKYLKKSGVDHYSISVFMPESAHTIFSNFIHLVEIGFKKLQINYALGVYWPKEKVQILFEETWKIIKFIENKNDITFVNLTRSRREPVVLNAELTVDCDGGLYLESGICLEEDFAAMKRKFFVAYLKDAGFSTFAQTTPFQNFYKLSEVYASINTHYRSIVLNNIIVGRQFDKFIKNEIRN